MDAANSRRITHEKIKSLVLSPQADGVPVGIETSRPEIKRKRLGEIVTTLAKKLYLPKFEKRASRGMGEDEVKIPYGYYDPS